MSRTISATHESSNGIDWITIIYREILQRKESLNNGACRRKKGGKDWPTTSTAIGSLAVDVAKDCSASNSHNERRSEKEKSGAAKIDVVGEVATHTHI
ncbi:unnamed protein product [Caenorhabditis auriculariae]|uniref:Uncharacterized protein n=1 Tax=Caenorhabditis auriculariae TaxID=2777116 RepID=A0A8S1HLI8_9PELO|nr:unnamed protein product [Caenorhabditis auriculariae]